MHSAYVAEKERADHLHKRVVEVNGYLHAASQALESESEKSAALVRALEYYARTDYCVLGKAGREKISDDLGDRARKALAEYRGEK